MRRCVVVLLVITATVVAAADWTELTRAGEWAFSRGDFSPLLGWLRDKVHAHGSRWEPAELVERAESGLSEIFQARTGFDLALEAVQEDFGLKRQILRELDKRMPEGNPIVITTSTLSITELATAADMAETFIGMHFMNPVPMMKLVEVICGQATSEATLATVTETLQALGLQPRAESEEKLFPGLDPIGKEIRIGSQRFEVVGVWDKQGGLFGTATEYVTAVDSLLISGAFEDGYSGIQYALDNYPFREDAEKFIILATDEDR